MQKRLLHLLSNVRLWRYFLVATAGTLLDILLYTLLTKGGAAHWIALSISFSSGVALGFIASRVWVFGSEDPRWKLQLIRFLLVIGVVYVLNGAVMEGLYAVLPLFMPWRSFWVRSIAALTVFPLSYILHRRVSFA